MCGRGCYSDIAIEASLTLSSILNHVEEDNKNDESGFNKDLIHGSYNLAPTKKMVLTSLDKETNKYKPLVGTWGIRKNYFIINYRTQNLAATPTKNTFFCVLVFDGYYEWKTKHSGSKNIKKQPYFIYSQDAKYLYIGAIAMRNKTSEYNFAIITQPAISSISSIHHQMPLILPDITNVKTFLDLNKTTQHTARKKLVELEKEIEKLVEKNLVFHPVSPNVNSVKYQKDDCNLRIDATSSPPKKRSADQSPITKFFKPRKKKKEEAKVVVL
eukprot:snap_masked-scaffold_2-processed-gene-22.20-mRNA-1 protein AED:1.00 eAED:1.00 QI:0/-1/0/0/-1/1/1/0/270